MSTEFENMNIRKTIDTGIISSHNANIKIRRSYIDNILGEWDEVGIEEIDEKNKICKNAVWFSRKDVPKLIAELQKFV